jgi:hypothetical protein
MGTDDRKVFDAARAKHRRKSRWLAAGVLLLILNTIFMGISIVDRATLHADQRLTEKALSNRGDLFKFVLDLPEVKEKVRPDKRTYFQEMQQRTGLPERSSIPMAEDTPKEGK